MEDLGELGARLEDFQERIKVAVNRPTGAKSPPKYNATQLAALCDKGHDSMSRLLEKAAERGLPEGLAAPVGGRSRVFSLADVRAWVKAVRPRSSKPTGCSAMTLTVANFKGGVGKTVLSMCLAQGLSLKGYRVLAIDFDPQGSLTTLFGITPAELSERDTVLPLMYERTHPDAADTLRGSIRATYWDGVDLVPAAHTIAAGDFYLPARQMKSISRNAEEPGFEFYEVLNKALNQGIRQEYDFIIIDTPPSLSFMVMTTVWAADALLLPLPPEGIDFMSTAQFWTMLSSLATGTPEGKVPKSYAWTGVVASKVDHTVGQTMEVLKWMRAAYSSMLLGAEIPDTAAVKVGGMQLQTVYDIGKYVGAQRTLVRARAAFDKLVDEVEYLTQSTYWRVEGGP